MDKDNSLMQEAIKKVYLKILKRGFDIVESNYYTHCYGGMLIVAVAKRHNGYKTLHHTHIIGFE